MNLPRGYSQTGRDQALQLPE